MLFNTLLCNDKISYNITFDNLPNTHISYEYFTCNYATGQLYIYFQRYPWRILLMYINKDTIIQYDRIKCIICKTQSCIFDNSHTAYDNDILLWSIKDKQLILQDNYYHICIMERSINYLFGSYSIIQYQDNLYINYNKCKYYLSDNLCKYIYNYHTLSYNNYGLVLKLTFYKQNDINKYCMLNYHVANDNYIVYKAIMYPNDNINHRYNDLNIVQVVMQYYLPLKLSSIFNYTLLNNYITKLHDIIQYNILCN